MSRISHFASRIVERPRTLLLTAIVVIILIVTFVGIAAAAYVWHVETPPISSLVGWLPAARVGTRTVSYAQYLRHVENQRAFLSGPAAQAQGLAGPLGDEERSGALERAIRIAAIDDMASKASLQVTPLDVERAYLGLIQRGDASTTIEEVRILLRDQFGMDESTFKEMVIRPALLEDTLRAQRQAETGDVQAFDRDFEARLQQPDVVRYIRFPSVAKAAAS